MAYKEHYSVMLDEVLAGLSIKGLGLYLDATFGAGGYSQAILSKGAKLIAFDRDASVINYVQDLQTKYDKNFIFFNEEFADIREVLLSSDYKLPLLDGIVFDIGVSSMQLDTPERGFSFRFDARLDMRMGCSELSAFEIVNEFSEEDLSDLLWEYGEERHSRKIAKAIIKRRKTKEISTTFELTEVIYSVIPRRYSDKIDPATRTFQALRIYVNDELEQLRKALDASIDLLKPEGRLVVVTFHSLEDRIVKHFLRENSLRKQKVNKYENKREIRISQENISEEGRNNYFKIINLKPIVASEEECRINSRSRSGRLRIAQRTDKIRRNITI